MGHDHGAARRPGAGHAHAHGHSHGVGTGTAAAGHRRRLAVVLALTGGVFVLELVGAWVSGSLALLADAAHMATDTLGIGMALGAITLAQRPARGRNTFGLQRIEVLAAVANGLLLLGVGVYVVVEAVRRIGDPPDIHSGWMLAIAVVGLVVNVGSLGLLHARQADSLSTRGAYLEVVGDALGSVAVIVAAVVISTTGWTGADVVASLAVGALVRVHVLGVPGVLEVHDLHAWTITSGLPVLSAHVVVHDDVLAQGHGGRVLDALSECLGGHFDLAHCTFQLESPAHRGHESPVHE
jgi:Co/Zn/Cd efflux system component